MRLLRSWRASLFIWVLLGLSNCNGQESLPAIIENGDMEAVEAEGKLASWRFNSTIGATFRADDTEPYQGRWSGRIDASKSAAADRRFSNCLQTVDGKPWRGKTVRFRAAVRTADLTEGSQAQMWFRVDREESQAGTPAMGAFDNMDNRPITSEAWKTYDITLKVDEDAKHIVLGMFVIGNGKAWIDNATLEEVAADTPTTEAKSSAAGMPPLVMKAMQQADKAPQQPFFTPWLILPAVACALFAFGMARWIPADREFGNADVSWFKRFAVRFTVVYWLLYCLPEPFASLIPGIGQIISQWYSAVEGPVVEFTARTVFGKIGPLVPPNGSGDTTYNYIAILNTLVLALVVACVWMLVDRRAANRAWIQDLLRSYLRYVLALSMLGYGLAKVAIEFNQFPTNSSWQLDKTWGASSPMNVLWAFMGASRPYTNFAGLCEIVAALLLIWRRTALLGAMVAIGVTVNIVMLNFCYDVPVKLYSTHLMVMACLILLPEAGRLLEMFVWHGAVSAPASRAFCQGKAWARTRVIMKCLVIGIGFALPVAIQSWSIGKYLVTESAKSEAPEDDFRSKYPLTRRGFRWINEVPFNR